MKLETLSPWGLCGISTDNIFTGCSTTGVKNWSSRHRWDGDQIFYYKPGVGENLFHWADMQTKQAAIVANDFIDFQVDGSAGTLAANNAPATGNISYVPAIGTQNMSTGSPDTHAFFGGIIVLRTVIQNDRDRLRTYFRTPR
ncbi:hypothetical protein ACHMW4_19060 [Mesorhizobium sp. UC22_110]|uniref:hypothetical protein n=1 Tax=Mesorhizobium sp. UC22_110 TaxID=3374552 RepID=UPI00375817F2